MEIERIAIDLLEKASNITLIYAFNGIGKTQLSVEYKNLTKTRNGGSHAGVYYNAYSEDLFQWDNDEENNNADQKLRIVFSSLNQYHSFIIEDPQKLLDNLNRFHVSYFYKLNYSLEDYSQMGIESVSFYSDEERSHPIKISRGEERIFVWCFFLTLFEVSNWTENQDAHIFIDDPVSSLDEHNIHITASTIMALIKNNFEKKRIIVTTHHVGLFSILLDRLRKASGSEKYKNVTKAFILGKDYQGSLHLSSFKEDVFLYHLRLYKMIRSNLNKSRETGQIESYNFVLLRQLLENISSFLGVSGSFNYPLSVVNIEKPEEIVQLINEQSHKDVYFYQNGIMSPEQAKQFNDVFSAIEGVFKFR